MNKSNRKFTGDERGAFEDFAYCDFSIDREVNYIVSAADDVCSLGLGDLCADMGEDCDGSVFLRGSVSAVANEGEAQ